MNKPHRSIRQFKPEPIPGSLLDEILLQGLRASSSGNMQTWSVVVSTEQELKQKLYVANHEQDMILQAPATLTFCADFHRMRRWLEQRGALSSFDDLTGFLTAAFDAMIAAQSVALAAEERGLGICYMGTTLWRAPAIAEILELPNHVVPVTGMVIGYPAENPDPRDRLPLEAVVHRERYRKESDADILRIYEEREVLGWQRYLARPGAKERMEKAGIENLAQFYSSDLKYGKELHTETSRDFLELLKKKGFWNF